MSQKANEEVPSTPFHKRNQPPQAVIFSASNSSICVGVSPQYSKPRCRDKPNNHPKHPNLLRSAEVNPNLVLAMEGGTGNQPTSSSPSPLVLPPTLGKPIQTTHKSFHLRRQHTSPTGRTPRLPGIQNQYNTCSLHCPTRYNCSCITTSTMCCCSSTPVHVLGLSLSLSLRC